MKGVGVFHREFACPHNTKSRATFIAELGLYLIKIGRQLTVAIYLVAHQIGDYFLMRRPKAEIALMPICKSE